LNNISNLALVFAYQKEIYCAKRVLIRELFEFFFNVLRDLARKIYGPFHGNVRTLQLLFSPLRLYKQHFPKYFKEYNQLIFLWGLFFLQISLEVGSTPMRLVLRHQNVRRNVRTQQRTIFRTFYFGIIFQQKLWRYSNNFFLYFSMDN